MKKYWILCGAVLLFIIIGFSIVEALEIPLLTDPSHLMEEAGVATALIGAGLLALDIVLPVPSSIVMVAHGAVFGIVLGSLVSLAGMLVSTVLGWWLGRKSDRLLKVNEEEAARARALFERWGLVALVVTRPIPMLSETMIIMAGAMGMPFGRMLLASLAGLLPGIVIYSITGALAATAVNGTIGFLIVIGIAGLFWLLGRNLGQPKASMKAQELKEPRAKH